MDDFFRGTILLRAVAMEFFYCVVLCSFHFIGFILNWILSSETLFHLAYSTSSVNAVVLTICLGSASSVPGNGVVWFIVVSSLIVSVIATVIFAIGVQDQFINSITNASMSWDIFVVQRDSFDSLIVRSQDPFQETSYQSQA
ncbi:hypothetical protein Tcan_05409 [Toxocara canis]|uniref:Transmembrane protein n=1 Tax=Toxocara canis TaxID=6265 RepID=A0A0B2VIL4_TOXCA|nr:hypothetical protein Tcan_05409 [Toxocara canis]